MAPSVVPPTVSKAGTVTNAARAALHTERFPCAWVHVYNASGADTLYLSGKALLDGTTPVGDATDGIPVGPGEIYQFPALGLMNAYDLGHLYIRGSAAAVAYNLLCGVY